MRARFAPLEWCGTIQGVLDCSGVGSIQNIGIVPSQRGSGLGSVLIEHALSGFQTAGAYRVTLEVTAENIAAIRLYQRLGFQRTKTIYKPVDSTFLTDGGHSSTSPLPLGFSCKPYCGTTMSHIGDQQKPARPDRYNGFFRG